MNGGKRKRLIAIAAAFILALVVIAGIMYEWGTPWGKQDDKENLLKKPVVYLYPQEKTEVQVKLDLAGQLGVTYPLYGKGWQVTANPDGTLINHADGREYSYLFWEGKAQGEFDFSKGFVVRGDDTAAFLEEKLAILGLNAKESNDFIVFWLPLMQHNAYNLIAFQEEAYTSQAKLAVTPEPDSELRVFMAYKPLEEPIAVPEQTLSAFTRKGFTVVEWGGAEVE